MAMKSNKPVLLPVKIQKILDHSGPDRFCPAALFRISKMRRQQHAVQIGAKLDDKIYQAAVDAVSGAVNILQAFRAESLPLQRASSAICSARRLEIS